MPDEMLLETLMLFQVTIDDKAFLTNAHQNLVVLSGGGWKSAN